MVQHSPLGFVIAFGAGSLSFLSPCVLPLVPSYLSMMSGLGARELTGSAGGPQRVRLAWSTVGFVAGFSLVFAIFEAGANALSQPLHAHKQALQYTAGSLIILMGLAIIASVARPQWLATLRLPLLSGEHRLAIRPSALGPWAAPVMGMAFAFGWTPCIGPVLVAVLGLASSTGTLGRGEVMLVAYSLGLGVPFIALGFAFGRLSCALSVARRHTRGITAVSGLVLAALGLAFVVGQVGTLSSWFASLLQHLGLGSLTRI